MNVRSRHLPPADLHIPVLGQLAPAEFALGDAFEPGSLEIVGFNAPLREQPLEHALPDPDHAVVLADLDRNSAACRSAFQRASRER